MGVLMNPVTKSYFLHTIPYLISVEEENPEISESSEISTKILIGVLVIPYRCFDEMCDQIPFLVSIPLFDTGLRRKIRKFRNLRPKSLWGTFGIPCGVLSAV
jgi:hypothetical protein